MKTRGPFGMVLVVALTAPLFWGCSARDVEKAFYAGAKIAYDSLKISDQPSRQ